MADIIATENDARIIGGSSASYTSNLCATKTRAIALNCIVSGSYSDNLLVPKIKLTSKKNYFKTTVTSAGTITFTGNNIEYSTDGGLSWATLSNGNATPNLSSGTEVLWRMVYDSTAGTNFNKEVGNFSSTCTYTVSGNIMSLLYGSNFDGLTSLPATRCFLQLFYRSTLLTGASGLSLPATTLTSYCYSEMFNGCTSLTSAPSLPATALASHCYQEMFYNCSSLVTPPTLGATTLAEYCYSHMFGNCSSLTSAPTLSATTMTKGCYYSMFLSCTRLTTPPALPSTNLAVDCYYSMFSGCTALTSSPVLRAITLANGCYCRMFYGCTSLTSAPALPATNLAANCYYSMFGGCTALTTAPSLPATTLKTYCYRYMFESCTALVNPPVLASTSLADGCYYGMFYGCNKLTTAPVLSAPTLVSECYSVMFYNCSKLNYIKCLATNILAYYCTREWVSGVAATGTFEKAPSMTSWSRGVNGIPTNWTVIGQQKDYLKFTTSSSGTFLFSDTIEYSTDNGGSWISLAAAANTPTLASGTNILWRKTFASGLGSVGKFSSTCSFSVSGNIMSLIYGDNFEGLTNLTGYSYVFSDLFSYCSTLTNASQLVLPATTLASYCYGSMFWNCSSLTSVPVLPATILADYCYYYMFCECSSLTSGPALNATTLAPYCYYNMFASCTSLTSAPTLPATTLAEYCYYYMFSGCTSLTSAPSLPATGLLQYCYGYMFEGCTSLTTAPALNATSLANYCYSGMFSKCSALTSIPTLPATTLTLNCYNAMFRLCTSLTITPTLNATTLASSCYSSMFYGCTSLTTVSALPATSLVNYCYYNMFGSCTSLTTAPTLSATTLAPYCYLRMFEGCSRLSYIKCLATDISASDCTRLWVNGVASSGTFVKASSISSWSTGINGIPSGWTVQNDSGPTLSLSSFGICLNNPVSNISTSCTWVRFSYDITIVAHVDDDSVAKSGTYEPTVIATYQAGTNYSIAWNSREYAFFLRLPGSISFSAPWIGSYDTDFHVITNAPVDCEDLFLTFSDGHTATFNDCTVPYRASYFKMNGSYPVCTNEETFSSVSNNYSGDVYIYIF